MSAEKRTVPAADSRGTADVEDIIVKLPPDQQKTVATILTLVSGQVEAARDSYEDESDLNRSLRWSGLAEGAHIVGCVAAFARGVAGL